MFCTSELIQGVHFRKRWRNVIRVCIELQLDTEVEFGAEDSDDAGVCYGNSDVLEVSCCCLILVLSFFFR